MDWNTDSAIQTTALNTLWSAAVFGTLLKCNAYSLIYGDKNGKLGITSENHEEGIPISQPLPIYYGIGMNLCFI